MVLDSGRPTDLHAILGLLDSGTLGFLHMPHANDEDSQLDYLLDYLMCARESVTSPLGACGPGFDLTLDSTLTKFKVTLSPADLVTWWLPGPASVCYPRTEAV